MRDEEVGAFDDVWDRGLAFRDEAGGGREVDGFRSTATGDEDVVVLLIAEVEGISEGRAVVDDFSRRQFEVGVFDQHAVAIFRQFGDVEVDDHLAGLGETKQLSSV